MSSHGVPRVSGEPPRSEQDRTKEARKIREYKSLIDAVNQKVAKDDLTEETLNLTSRLLTWNPEYYSIWNVRRRIVCHLLKQMNTSTQEHAPIKDSSEKCIEALPDLISNDLNFQLPLLRKFPKCYWIWNYRLWLLEEPSGSLPRSIQQKLWEQELSLAGKMLSLDSRNFNGWGYRRKVIAALERLSPQKGSHGQSLTESEFEYTTKMINTNLSNFSAWHNRSVLIPRLLNERQADKQARKKMLEQELELIQRALWAGDNDSSLWFYHQNLMCAFDPQYAAGSMAPELSHHEREAYLKAEIEKVHEMLEGAEDCKWIYQSLIQLNMLHKSLSGETCHTIGQIIQWVETLNKVDILRSGRWNDLLQKLRPQ